MTITVTIKNEGPHAAGLMYYDESRRLKPYTDTLKPGESITVNVWNGNLPVVLPYGPPPDVPHLFRSPPASVFGTEPGGAG